MASAVARWCAQDGEAGAAPDRASRRTAERPARRAVGRPGGARRAADWHPADVIAALRKAGWSCRRLSQHHGYYSEAVAHALHKQWPAVEALIADALQVHPATLWPSRYDAAGQPLRRTRHAMTSGRKGNGHARREDSP